MRRGLITFILLITASCFLNAGMRLHIHAKESGPVIQFDVLVHDFGTMREGDVIDCVFKFTNKGDAPLIVEDVEQPCGCTVPSWSKEPIMPGRSGEIKVLYNSKDRPGIFRKTLAVKTNAIFKTKEPLLLMVKGDVLTKKQWRQRSKNQ